MAQYEKYQAAQEHLQEIQQRWEGNIRAHEEDMQKVLTIAQAEWEGKLNTKVTEIEKVCFIPHIAFLHQVAKQMHAHTAPYKTPKPPSRTY